MKESKRLIKNTGIIAVGNMSTKVISFFLLPLYTACLSTADYGTYDYIASIAIFVIPFITVLMDESMFRFLIDCKDENEQKEVVSSSITIIIFGLIFFLGISLLLFSFIDYDYKGFLILYILSHVMCSIVNPLLRGFGRIKAYSLYNFLLSLSTVVLNVIFIALFRWGLYGMFLANIISYFSVSVIFACYGKLWKYCDFSRVKMHQLKEMMVYSWPLIPNKVSWSIINLSDRIIIMNIIGSAASGLYAVAYKFPNMMDMIYGFFYQSWKESSARALNSEDTDVFYNTVYRYLKTIMYSLVLVLTAFMPLIFKLMVNRNYHEGILYVPILLLATYFSNISGFYGGVFTAYKDTKIMGSTTLAAAIINLIINLALIRYIGLYAAALSTLIADFVVYLYRKRKVKKYVLLKESKKSVTMAGLFTIVILTFFYSRNISLQIAGALFSIVYAVICNYSTAINLLRFIRYDS